MKRWFKYLLEAYKYKPVVFLGGIGSLGLIAAMSVEGWSQSVLIEIGAALLLIPPIVVTERFILAEDVQENTKRAIQEVSRLRDGLLQEHNDLIDLFTEENGFLATEALQLFQDSSKKHHISKWGVAVPLIEGRYDLLLGFHFSERHEGSAYFLPSYVIDVQKHINVRVLSSKDPGPVILEMLWNIDGGENTISLMRRVREELLDQGLHPNEELNFVTVCKRLKETLVLRAKARMPGNDYLSNLGAIICLVGNELAITTEGIEHLTLSSSEAIPIWATFKSAGLDTKKSDDDFLLSDEYYFDGSGIKDHPELSSALAAVKVMYKSRFLSLVSHNVILDS